VAYDTAANILNDAAIELGLYATALADPFASTDPNVIQLCRQLKRVGKRLVRAHGWQQLQKTHTFSTANGTASYALPADFARVVDETFWNRTQVMPLVGPAEARAWQYLKARTSTGIHKVLRLYGDLVYLDPTPTAIETVAYEYISNYWVKPSGQSAPTTEWPGTPAGTDTLYFDSLLLVDALRVAFLRSKGFDSTAAEEDLRQSWLDATGADGAAPVLYLSGSSPAHQRLIDSANYPETGFGS
jgi:hypothetical protein